MIRSSRSPLSWPYYHFAFGCPCNLECFYCYEGAHPARNCGEPLDAIEARLLAGRRAGYEMVFFGSGELLLHAQWREILAAARAAGYEATGLITNLTTLREDTAQQLVAGGVTWVVGSLFALDDEGAAEVAGGPNTFTHQMAAIRAIGAVGLNFWPHAIVTRQTRGHLMALLDTVEDALGRPVDTYAVSAIEPPSPETAADPRFVDSRAVDWPALMAACDARGTRVVTQTVPTCLLGDWGHRNWQLHRRVARVLAGWPEDAASQRLVTDNEQPSLSASPCAAGARPCERPTICANRLGLPCAIETGAPDQTGAQLAALLAEIGVEVDEDLVRRVREGLVSDLGRRTNSRSLSTGHERGRV